jgi:hypothetical protein
MTARREKLEAMLVASPDDQTLRYMLGLELEKEGQHERSLELLMELQCDPTPYVPAFLMAGQQLTRQGRIPEAIAVYQTGIQAAEVQGNSHASGEMAGFLAAITDQC